MSAAPGLRLCRLRGEGAGCAAGPVPRPGESRPGDGGGARWTAAARANGTQRGRGSANQVRPPHEYAAWRRGGMAKSGEVLHGARSGIRAAPMGRGEVRGAARSSWRAVDTGLWRLWRAFSPAGRDAELRSAEGPLLTALRRSAGGSIPLGSAGGGGQPLPSRRWGRGTR